MPAQFEINERTSGTYTATLLDDTGTPVPAASIEDLRLWLYEKTRKSIINARGTIEGNGQDVLAPGGHGVSIHATSGLLTWLIAPLDTVCVLTTPPTTPKVKEIHVAVFKMVWGSGSKGLTHSVELVITDMLPNVNYVTP